MSSILICALSLTHTNTQQTGREKQRQREGGREEGKKEEEEEKRRMRKEEVEEEEEEEEELYALHSEQRNEALCTTSRNRRWYS